MSERKDNTGLAHSRASLRWIKIEAKARWCKRRFALWPWYNSERHIAVAQFELETERARRASAEKDGRA